MIGKNSFIDFKKDSTYMSVTLSHLIKNELKLEDMRAGKVYPCNMKIMSFEDGKVVFKKLKSIKKVKVSKSKTLIFPKLGIQSITCDEATAKKIGDKVKGLRDTFNLIDSKDTKTDYLYELNVEGGRYVVNGMLIYE